MVDLTTIKPKLDLFARLPAETIAIDLAGVIAVRGGNWQDLCPEGGDGCWEGALNGLTNQLSPLKTKAHTQAYFSLRGIAGKWLGETQ